MGNSFLKKRLNICSRLEIHARTPCNKSVRSIKSASFKLVLPISCDELYICNIVEREKYRNCLY